MILHWVPLQLTAPVVSSEMIHIPPETLEMKTRKGALKEKENKTKDKRESPPLTIKIVVGWPHASIFSLGQVNA